MLTRSLGVRHAWLIAAFFVILSVDAYADEILAPEDLFRLKRVSSAEISPDGKWIAYLLGVPRQPFEDDDGPAWAELHVSDMQGNSRPFITGEASVSAIAWLPNSRAISFLTKRGKDEHKSLYVIPIDGGEARQVLTFDSDIDSYSWSHDGKRVAVIAKEKKPKEKKELEDKGFNQEVFEEDFTAQKLWLAVPDDKDSKPTPMDLPGTPDGPLFSPVNSQIALTLAPTPFIDDFYMRRRLHVFDADDGSIVSSFQNPGKLGEYDWSPDGKRLAVVSGIDLNDPAEGRLMIANPADGLLKEILPNFLGHVGDIDWQDVSTVMYLAEEGVWTTFNEIGADGENRKTHIAGGKIVAGSFSLSADGQSAAMLVESDKHPSELFVMSHGDKGPRRLTNSNPWLDDLRLAKQEVIKYKARDGLEVEAVLIHPLDEQPGAKYPLIVDVHGGPEARDSMGWNTRYAGPGQMAAARGYFVMLPNYRGSTGRGVDYTKLHQADYAGKEFDDIVDGVDYLVNQGLVDRAKVGVTGGSYGGFATAWLSTYYTDRFAAGVMFVGISDHVAKTGTTDIPDEMTLVHARKRLWEDYQFFLERSPIRYVEKARTPLLIMHGKEDTRVHPSQSLELYRHLEVLNQTPVRLVWYPGEGHGNRRAASQYDYALRMLQWFDHYLKGEGGEPPAYEIEYPLQALAKEKEKAKEDSEAGPSDISDKSKERPDKDKDQQKNKKDQAAPKDRPKPDPDSPAAPRKDKEQKPPSPPDKE